MHYVNIGDLIGISVTLAGYIAGAFMGPLSPSLALMWLACGGVVTGILHSHFARRKGEALKREARQRN